MVNGDRKPIHCLTQIIPILMTHIIHQLMIVMPVMRDMTVASMDAQTKSAIQMNTAIVLRVAMRS
jgi:hypothetical protein